MEEYPKIRHGSLHINKDVAYRVTIAIHTVTCYNEAKAKNVYNQLVTGLKSDS